MAWVVFLQDVPEFIGPDAETTYGPYKAGDIADVPDVIADILAHRGAVMRLGNRSGDG